VAARLTPPPPVAALLRYASSMNANRPALALYERARSLLPAAATLDLPLATAALAAPLAAAAIRFGYALV